MLANECRVGMRVYFGRPNGEKTLGKVVKCNPNKAKIETLEERGRSHQAGVIWSVPYSCMTLADAGTSVPEAQATTVTAVTAVPTPLTPPLTDSVRNYRLRNQFKADFGRIYHGSDEDIQAAIDRHNSWKARPENLNSSNWTVLDEMNTICLKTEGITIVLPSGTKIVIQVSEDTECMVAVIRPEGALAVTEESGSRQVVGVRSFHDDTESYYDNIYSEVVGDYEFPENADKWIQTTPEVDRNGKGK